MNKTSHFLKVIQIFRLIVSPLFFIPIRLKRNGFSTSKIGIAIIFCPFITTVSCKAYFFSLYELRGNEYYIQTCTLLLAMSLCILSYLGYANNSASIAKILNNIAYQSKLITDEVFCRRVRKFLIIQIIICHSIPLLVGAWCNYGSFFNEYNNFWQYTVDIWLDYLLRIHLTATTVIFANAVLMCHQTIAKANKELSKLDRNELCGSVQVYLINQEKNRNKSLVISNNSELASMISTYDNVCQSCEDLTGHFGCSVSCSYFCNLVQMIMVVFFMTKYGISELWTFLPAAFYNFLQNWFMLYACESFTKEMQKTAVMVNRIILETKNQKQKEILQQFSIFLLHRKVKFTAWGLFPLDYKQVYSALSTMITYLALAHQIESES